MSCRVSDVAGRIHVCVAGESAGPASEGGLALTRLRIHGPARRASLTRVRGIDLVNSLWSLVLQPGHEPPPAGGEDSPVQTGLGANVAPGGVGGALGRASHGANVEIFDGDDIEATRQSSGRLLDPVLAAVAFTSFQPCDRGFDLRTAIRTRLRTRELLKQSEQAGLLGVAKARQRKQLARRQGCRYHHTSVNAHHLSRTGRGNRIGNCRERDMPASRPIACHPVRLGTRRDGAGPAEPNPPHLRYPHLTDPAGQAADTVRLDRDDPKSFVSSPLTPCRPPVGATEEIRHRLREVFERLLLHGDRARAQPVELRTRASELAALLGETRYGPATRPPVSMLLNCQIPDKSSMSAMLQQHRLLSRGGLETEAGHADELTDRHRQNTEKQVPRHSAHCPGGAL